jgi:formiminotetrahydrofolate cyclodeaminase
MYDRNTTIQQFLDVASAKQPTPGGGSIAALAGALAGSMGEMVVNYSLGKKDLALYEVELRPALEVFHRARMLMLELMVEDQTAYTALSAARKLGDGSERREQFPAALLASIRTPQAIAAVALQVLQLCDQIVDFVNPWLLSDLAVCADLSMATVRCATYNVRANLPDVTEPGERADLESSAQNVLSRAIETIQRVSPRIWARAGQGR